MLYHLFDWLTENGIKFPFNEHMMKEGHTMIQFRCQKGSAQVGIFTVKTKTTPQVGDKNTEDGEAPEHIHESFSFIGLNRVQCLHTS